MAKLTCEQVARYRRDGFLAPVEAFTSDEAAGLRSQLEAFERTLPEGPVAPVNRRKLHVRLPWMRDLVEDARIVDAVEDLIGPDILVFNSTFFIKEPQTGSVTAWHQDATYFGLDPHEHVTAWVAFSNASEASGCIEFVKGSQAQGQLRHAAQGVANSVNHGSQTIAVPFDTGNSALAPLRPGQFSLHHTFVVHQSAPNRSEDRRIGCGISYIPARTRHKGSFRMAATLVRGTNDPGNFELEPDPRGMRLDAAAVAHERAYGRYREGYQEQMEAHARIYA